MWWTLIFCTRLGLQWSAKCRMRCKLMQSAGQDSCQSWTFPNSLRIEDQTLVKASCAYCQYKPHAFALRACLSPAPIAFSLGVRNSQIVKGPLKPWWHFNPQICHESHDARMECRGIKKLMRAFEVAPGQFLLPQHQPYGSRRPFGSCCPR